MRRRGSGGVTLTEALIVMAILSVLAAFAYQNFWKSAEKARIRAGWSMLRLMDGAVRACASDHGNDFLNADCIDLATLVTEGYLDDPNQGQTDWEYLINAGPPRVEARRTAGPCTNKRLKRFYPGAGVQEGNEEETMPGCP